MGKGKKGIAIGGGILALGAIVAKVIHIHEKKNEGRAAYQDQAQRSTSMPGYTDNGSRSDESLGLKAHKSGTISTPALPATSRIEPMSQQSRGPSNPASFGLDPNDDYGYAGTTKMTYTANGVPQVPTRNRFGDVPNEQKTQAQWNANHWDAANRTAHMRDAMNIMGIEQQW